MKGKQYNRNQIWWETVSVPVRVRLCKQRRLEGRTASKTYEDLSIEQRERLFGENIIGTREMVLEDHARAWWADQGIEMPDACFQKGKEMYEKWAKWAFKDFK